MHLPADCVIYMYMRRKAWGSRGLSAAMELYKKNSVMFGKRRCIMRFIVLSVCLLAAGLIFALPVSAADRRMQQSYTIEIEVECLETAIEVLRALPGHNLFSNITYDEPHMGRSFRQASFNRRIDSWAFRHAQAVLREMGEVLSENEHARHLGAELMQLETRLTVLSQEIDRLSILMAASNSLHVLIAIDSQLSRVAWERDRLIGRHNQLLAESESAFVQIWLTERSEYRRPEPPGFGRRIGDSFMDSWNALLRNGGNFTVLAARIGLPLLIWAVIIGAAAWVCIRTVKEISKRKRAIREETMEAPKAEEEEVTHEQKDV
jgi:hypothetical protein